MARRDVYLVGAPAELPQGKRLAGLRHALGVVVAGDVAEAEEDVGEAVLYICFVRLCFLTQILKSWGWILESGNLGDLNWWWGVAVRTYQRIQLIINRALPCLIAIPRMITRAIYTICVLLLRLIVERAITYRGGERIWIVFQPREDATAVFGCILDEFAVRAETADFVGG